MKNNTSILLSICGGIIVGSALTCVAHKYGKGVDKAKVHKKIIDELAQLRSYIKSNAAEGGCCRQGEEPSAPII